MHLQGVGLPHPVAPDIPCGPLPRPVAPVVLAEWLTTGACACGHVCVGGGKGGGAGADLCIHSTGALSTERRLVSTEYWA